MATDAIGESILIRYDGLDADNHEMEMAALADSLKGLSRVIGICGNFAATQRYVQHKDALAVRVVVRPGEPHCLELWATIQWASENPLIATTVGGLFATVVAYVFKRAAGQREEMKQLRGALDTAIKELGTREQATVERLLDTVDKMADGLKAAARQSVEPIGQTATTLTIGGATTKKPVVLGQAERDAIVSEAPPEIDQERTYRVVISELDMDSGSCRLRFEDEPENRVSGQITDPAVSSPNNPYVAAMAAKRVISVRAKAALREGGIEKMYISNTADEALAT